MLIYLFLGERERERERASAHARGRGRETGRQRIPSRLCKVRREPGVGLEP